MALGSDSHIFDKLRKDREAAPGGPGLSSAGKLASGFISRPPLDGYRGSLPYFLNKFPVVITKIAESAKDTINKMIPDIISDMMATILPYYYNRW